MLSKRERVANFEGHQFDLACVCIRNILLIRILMSADSREAPSSGQIVKCLKVKCNVFKPVPDKIK